MNPAKALASMRTVLPERPRPSSIREVEASWRALFGLAGIDAPVVVSTGVRPLLARLFSLLAREGRRLIAPQDVYPAYLQTASSVGLPITTFATVPAPEFPRGGSGPEVLLVPEPLVPLGRALAPAEWSSISAWLAGDPRRLLVLDCVYTFETRFPPLAQTLLGDGRTIVVHSLAKSFLQPDVAGFMLGPRRVLEGLEHDIGSAQLAAAAHILSEGPDLPVRLARTFAERWARLEEHAGCHAPATGYFAIVPSPFEELLARGWLAVPGSVFGALDSRWCAVTCLLEGEPA